MSWEVGLPPRPKHSQWADFRQLKPHKWVFFYHRHIFPFPRSRLPLGGYLHRFFNCLGGNQGCDDYHALHPPSHSPMPGACSFHCAPTIPRKKTKENSCIGCPPATTTYALHPVAAPGGPTPPPPPPLARIGARMVAEGSSNSERFRSRGPEPLPPLTLARWWLSHVSKRIVMMI